MPKGLKNCFLYLNEANRKRLGVFVWVRGVCGEWLRGERGGGKVWQEWRGCVAWLRGCGR